MAGLRVVVPGAAAAIALIAALAAMPVGAQQPGSPGAPRAQAAPADEPYTGPRRSDERERWRDERREFRDRGRGADGWTDGDRRSFQDYAPGYDRGERRRRDDERRERWGFGDQREPGFGREGAGGRAIGPQAFGRMCRPGGGRMIGFMLYRLERITSPTEAQRASLDKLKEAAGKAIETVRASCPAERPVSPPGRLATAEKRLEALLQAVRMVRPAMDEYYGSLSEEQKARLYASAPRPDWRERFEGRGDDRWEDRRPDGWRERERRELWRDGRRDRNDNGERWRRGRGGDRDGDGWLDPWRGRS